MPIPSGSYGYVVVKGDWIAHEAVQKLLAISRSTAIDARMTGYYMLEARILDDSSGAGLLAEVEIRRAGRNGDEVRTMAAQVLIPWAQVLTVACFGQEEFGEVRRGIGFQPRGQ